MQLERSKVKGAVFAQQDGVAKVEAMCRRHRPQQKPAVRIQRQ
eukprot:gene9064-9234_t